MRAIVVGNLKEKIDNIAAAQISPFFANRWRLWSEVGLRFKHIQAYKFSDISRVCQKEKADIFFIRPDWRESSDEADKSIQSVRAANPDSKIIFLDPFDQTSSRYFSVLPYVDKFLKYQRLKDTSQYSHTFIGGSFLTDYLVKNFHYDLNGWDVGSHVPAGYESRIDSYWHPAISFYKDFQKPVLPAAKKDIDIFCRLSFGPPNKIEWYGQHRLSGVRALLPLEKQYKLAVDQTPEGASQVSRKQYLNEIRRSRIVFSPFGWGEITWRDYEAACHGCLLIKPLIDHVDTHPNIFFPDETYVPVRWDFQDLEEKCRFYLECPDEAARIIENARNAYEKFFQKREFVQVIKNICAV